MHQSTLSLIDIPAQGRAFFEKEMADMKTRIEQFAHDCALGGKPLEFGDSMHIYIQPIRSWFLSLHASLRSIMEIERIPAYLQSMRQRFTKETQEITEALEEKNIRNAMAIPPSSEPPTRKVLARILLTAHIIISLTEATTIASALQLFGTTFLVSAIVSVSLFFFFYFLPIIILRIVSHISGERRKFMTAALMALIVSGLFWFLGTLRASYSSANSESTTLAISPLVYLVFNWMFLCLSIYLMYRRKELETGIQQERKDVQHAHAVRVLQEEIHQLEAKRQQARTAHTLLEEHASAVLAAFRSLEGLLTTQFNEAVEVFKVTNLKLRERVVPDCFTKKTPPLSLPPVHGELPTLQ